VEEMMLTGGTHLAAREKEKRAGLGCFGCCSGWLGPGHGPGGLATSFSFFFCSGFFFFLILISVLDFEKATLVCFEQFQNCPLLNFK
jgi:hypothetical protein